MTDPKNDTTPMAEVPEIPIAPEPVAPEAPPQLPPGFAAMPPVAAPAGRRTPSAGVVVGIVAGALVLLMLSFGAGWTAHGFAFQAMGGRGGFAAGAPGPGFRHPDVPGYGGTQGFRDGRGGRGHRGFHDGRGSRGDGRDRGFPGAPNGPESPGDGR